MRSEMVTLAANRTGAAILLSLALSACVSGGTVQQLRRRAAYDMDCSASSLQLDKLDAKTTGVRGCGKKAVYVKICDRFGQYGEFAECGWVLNSSP